MEKLQKLLAAAGLGSRREIEDWIRAGRVTIDGRVAELGARAVATATICVDGRRIELAAMPAPRVIAYNKPEGELCTRSDPQGRPTVFATLPRLRSGRWVAIGRLDVNTTGLLLFTTDGELANRLMHPSTGIEREYRVRVRGQVTPAVIARLAAGVELDAGPARFERIQAGGGEGSNRWFSVVLREGRNREVRRLWESQDCVVSRLKRVRYGPVVLPSWVRLGQWVELPLAQIAALYRAAGLQLPKGAAPPPARLRDQERRERRLRAGGRRASRRGG